MNIAIFSGEDFQLVEAFDVPCCYVGVTVTTNGPLRKLKRAKLHLCWPGGEKFTGSTVTLASKTYVQTNANTLELQNQKVVINV